MDTAKRSEALSAVGICIIQSNMENISKLSAFRKEEFARLEIQITMGPQAIGTAQAASSPSAQERFDTALGSSLAKHRRFEFTPRVQGNVSDKSNLLLAEQAAASCSSLLTHTNLTQ